jgi:hypothetical protein
MKLKYRYNYALVTFLILLWLNKCWVINGRYTLVDLESQYFFRESSGTEMQ